MISPRKTKANRANARLSTGPRTSAGKATVAQNALRHGLSLPLVVDGPLSALIERLTKELVGAAATPEQQELAREVAYAQFRLVRVRRARQDLSVMSSELTTQSVRRIAALHRYERRAFSKRRAAIRAFDNAARQNDGDPD